MTHVYPFKDEGSDRIRSQVFDKRAATEAPSTSGGSGDVVGPASATANAVALFDGTTGKLLKDSAKTFIAANLPITDSGGYFTGTDVEAALQELGAGGSGASAGYQIGYARTVSTTVASTNDTSIPRDATIPQSGEGVAYASLDTTITPSASTSLLEVEVTIPYVTMTIGATSAIQFALFRDSGANAIAATTLTIPTSGFVLPLVLRVVVAASSTSATTFKLRWSVSGGTGYLLQSTGSSNIFSTSNVAVMTVKEIKQ